MLLNIFPFSRFMTDRAQGNKVIQVVCKLVIGKFGKIRIMAHNLPQDAGADLERIPIPGAQPVYFRVSGTAFGIESLSKRLWI